MKTFKLNSDQLYIVAINDNQTYYRSLMVLYIEFCLLNLVKAFLKYLFGNFIINTRRQTQMLIYFCV